MSIVETPALPDRQAEFVRLIVAGKEPDAAAQLAGYAGKDASWRLMRLPQVAASLHMEVQRMLVVDAPVSWRVLREIRDNVKTPARTRADVSVQLLKLAGHVAPTSREQANAKQINEMTSEELLAYIDRNSRELARLEQELASRGAPLDTPHGQVADAKALDYLE